MKHIICIVTFAAWAAAQSPQSEFARVVALDEQQHDLGAAEAGYRRLLEGQGASGGASRAEVAFRLGRLLLRLGRGGEAQSLLAEAAAGGKELADGVARLQREFGQDGEREKELRARAREIIQKVFARVNAGGPNVVQQPQSPFHPYSTEDAANLQWIGAPAVTELIAQFDVEPRDSTRPGTPALIWKIGGPAAEAWADRIAAHSDVEVRAHAASGAFAASKGMEERARAWLADADPQGRVVTALLGTTSGSTPFTLTDLVGVARRGPAAARVAGLQRISRDWEGSPREQQAAALAAGIVDVVREALRTQDPGVGRAAMWLLTSQLAIDDPDARLLLIENLGLVDGHSQFPQFRLTAPDEHVAAMAEAARRIGPAPSHRERYSGSHFAFAALLERYLQGWSAPAFPAVKAALDAGFEPTGWPVSISQWLAQHATAEQLVEVIPLLPKSRQPSALLMAMGRRPGPTTALPALLRVAGDIVSPSAPLGESLAFAVAAIGRADAAPALVDLEARSLVDVNSALMHLVNLIAKHDTPPVREALRKLVTSDTGDAALRFKGAYVLLAVEDVATIELLPSVLAVQPRKDGRFQESSIGVRLFGASSDIPAPIRERIAEVLVRQSPQDVIAAMPEAFGAIGPNVAQMLFPLAVGSVDTESDSHRLTKALQSLTHSLTYPTQLRDSGRELVADVLKGGRPRALAAVVAGITGAKSAKAFEGELTPMLDDARMSTFVAECLIEGGAAADLAWLTRLLGSRFERTRLAAIRLLAPKLGREAVPAVAAAAGDPVATVREAACTTLGTLLDPGAVPALLGAMKDERESVRKAAADALSAIRFHHETKAHFDRVLSGLDPSAPSVTAKLLHQAKPDQPTEQRMLAIRSLGSLGAPEALPFLIDWTTDADPEITAAARAAITQIHAKTAVK